MKAYDRKDLINKIVKHLLDDGLLNTADCSSIPALQKEAAEVIEYELKDYKIFQGDIL